MENKNIPEKRRLRESRIPIKRNQRMLKNKLKIKIERKIPDKIKTITNTRRKQKKCGYKSHKLKMQKDSFWLQKVQLINQ